MNILEAWKRNTASCRGFGRLSPYNGLGARFHVTMSLPECWTLGVRNPRSVNERLRRP
jgi:hypothetical protein